MPPSTYIPPLTSGDLRNRFPQLSPQLREAMLAEGQLRVLKPQESILEQGQMVQGALLLVDGLLRVFREEEGREAFLYYLEPGQACAITFLCLDRSQAAEMRVSAEHPSRVLTIPFSVTENWPAEHPSWHQFVVGTYRHRFDELLAAFDAVAFRDLDERLRLHLKKHWRTNGGVLFRSHQQIAQELSTSREVISRLLKKLERQGLLELGRNEVRLLEGPDWSAE